MKKIIYIFLLIACIIAISYTKPAESGFYFSQSLGGMYNPLGAQSDSRIFYRIPLIKSSEMLFESTKLDIGLVNWLTPLDDMIGAYFNVEPIAFFDLTVLGGYHYTYNALGFGFWPVNNVSSDYSPDAKSKIKPENKPGIWIAVTPTLKLKLNNIIFANSFTYNYIKKLEYSGYYIEPRADAIMKDSDSDLLNDTYLFYQLDEIWMAGLNHYYLYVPGTLYSSERLCAVLIFTPKINGLYDFYTVGMVGSFIQDHYYKGMLYIALQAGITIKF